MLFFADSGERALVQAMLMGIVVAGDRGDAAAAALRSTHPFNTGFGGLQPVAMERTLRIMDQELKIVGPIPIPCDAHGNLQAS